MKILFLLELGGKMYNKTERDEKYIKKLNTVLETEYGFEPVSIFPAIRGYYGETWKVISSSDIYFVKIDYFPRHKEKFKNSLPVVNYLYNNGINFINRVIETVDRKLYSTFNNGIIAGFNWIEGINIELDETKASEYEMLGKIYPLTKQGFNIPILSFNSEMADELYIKWNLLKKVCDRNKNSSLLNLLEKNKDILDNSAKRLEYFSNQCKDDKSDFFFTHGDAGGNFIASESHNYIVDWDEVMYAPVERDAWVMCHKDWARELFNRNLRNNGIEYSLKSERLAFFIYHMFFLYLNEFIDDYLTFGSSEGVLSYFDDFMIERVEYADTL